jgi:hypothetical protein
MSILEQCSFYRGSETLSTGSGIGYCDLDCNRTACKGDIHFCEKYDVLRKYQLEQKNREGDLKWEKR